MDGWRHVRDNYFEYFTFRPIFKNFDDISLYPNVIIAILLLTYLLFSSKLIVSLPICVNLNSIGDNFFSYGFQFFGGGPGVAAQNS